MKNARQYEKKLKKLLSGMGRTRQTGDDEQDPVAVLIEAIFQADSTRTDAAHALREITEEFVDWNELRVAPPRDIVSCVGKDTPRADKRATMLVDALGGIYRRTCGVSMEYMQKMSKRDLRRHLSELGLDAYSGAVVTLLVFGGHAIPVDDDLADSLKMDQYADPDAELDDIQGFLRRIIPMKDALAAHEFFRAYVEKSAKSLDKKRKADAKAKEKQERLQAAKKKAKKRKTTKKPKKTPKPAKRKTAKRKTTEKKTTKTKRQKKGQGKTRKKR